VDLDEQQRLVGDLGANDAMILRNHGLLAVGRTIPEAFITMFWLERACQAQVAALSCNTELIRPAEDVVRRTNDRYKPGQRRKIGELEWAGLLRMLDRKDPSYKE
jgi:ribulose-5-phosphate 4-epimerase/fuculose-1-phosphate aldolase